MPSYSCVECGNPFTHPSLLRAHRKIHANPEARRVGCSQCDKVFTRKGHLTRHVRQVHELHASDKPFACTYCDKNFWSTTTRNVHVGTHTRERPFSCQQCNRGFAEQKILAGHVRNVHQRSTEVHTCPEPGCAKQYKHRGNLRDHLRTHSEARPTYPCPTCGKILTTKKGLALHLKFTHERGERQHSCSYCDKKFVSSSHLVHHVRKHTGEKPYSCKQCGVKFVYPPSVARHQKLVHGTDTAEPQKCSWGQCEKSYTNSAQLLRHIGAHKRSEKAQLLPCSEECGKLFKSKLGMKLHVLRAHRTEEEYPHTCPYCGKKFVGPSDMGRHLRVHTGERPVA